MMVMDNDVFNIFFKSMSLLLEGKGGIGHGKLFSMEHHQLINEKE